MFCAIVWTTRLKQNNNKKPWKRLQVLIAARSLNKTFLLYVLQSCYTTAKTCVTTYNKCLCLHNILYWIQYSKSKIAENKQAILRMNCMYFHKKFQNNTYAQKFNILVSIKFIIQMKRNPMGNSSSVTAKRILERLGIQTSSSFVKI